MKTEQLEVLELNEEPLPCSILDRMLQGFDRTGHRFWLCGGAARSLHTGEPIKDFDIVFGDYDSMFAFREHLLLIGATLVSNSAPYNENKLIGQDFVFEGQYIQLKFVRYYKTPFDFLDAFDFTICQYFYALGDVAEDEYRFGCSVQGLIDTKCKILRIHKLTQPVATIARINKFVVRGYIPYSNVEFYRKLVEGIREMPYSVEAFEPIRKRQV